MICTSLTIVIMSGHDLSVPMSPILCPILVFDHDCLLLHQHPQSLLMKHNTKGTQSDFRIWIICTKQMSYKEKRKNCNLPQKCQLHRHVIPIYIRMLWKVHPSCIKGEILGRKKIKYRKKGAVRKG